MSDRQSSNLTDDIQTYFIKQFAKYTKTADKYKKQIGTLPVELSFEGVPKPYLVHSSAIKRLKLSTNASDKSMLVLKPPKYDTPERITDSYSEKFKLSSKYATIKIGDTHQNMIKLTYEFVEWIGDITKELKTLVKNKKNVLTDLPNEIYQSIADNLRPKDVITLRRTAKVFNKNIRKPKNLLHKHDVRNYLPDSVVSELDLDYKYLPNEAKVLFLAKEINENYDDDGCLNDEHDDLIKPTILKSGASEGDIIFAGDTCETRQQYGFYIKTKKGFIDDNEEGYYWGPKGLVKLAKELYPTKNYDNALELLNAMWKHHFDRSADDYESEGEDGEDEDDDEDED